MTKPKKKKGMRAILIDPLATPAVREEEIAGDLDSLQGFIGGYITLVRLGDHVVFVDEEWDIKDPAKRHGGHFSIGGCRLGGRGIILGVKGSDHKGATLPLLKASQLVTIL